MSRKGDCWDNALAEGFFKLLKVEFVDRCKFASRSEAVTQIQNWIEQIFNAKRIKKRLGYRSPNEFELAHKNNVVNM
jgi:transposase InsO family protein